MAKLVKQLTDTEIKKAKYTSKEDFEKLKKLNPNVLRKNKLSDGKGLFLILKSNGTKFWQFDFSFGGKRKSMSFGSYPTVSLKEARTKREDARNNIQNNINPINQKKEDKENQKLIFEYIAEKWIKNTANLSDETRLNYKRSLDKNVNPLIGKLELHNIKRKHIVNVLISLQDRTTVASRIYNLLQRIFSYSAINYDLKYNPVDFNLNDLITRKKISHHKAIINEDKIKELISDIKNLSVEDKDYLHYSGVYALKMLPYMFVRITSLLKSKWDDIDFENETWLFPAKNTKTKEDYLYPMPKQIIDLLMDLNEDTIIKSEYVFHSAQNNPKKYLSRATVSNYLKQVLGYDGEMTLHGFRSTFSTTMNRKKGEHGYSEDIIEACLSHSERNRVKKAYDREYLDKHIDEKRQLIQWYADYLDKQ